MQKSGPLFKLVPGFLSRLGKVLHHSTAHNPRRNEYLVTFDFDVDNDNLPDQLFALRVDTTGNIVDLKLLNYTANINKKAGILKKVRMNTHCQKQLLSMTRKYVSKAFV